MPITLTTPQQKVYGTPSRVRYLTQGHTAVAVGTDMIIFGGVVNGERVNEVSVSMD